MLRYTILCFAFFAAVIGCKKKEKVTSPLNAETKKQFSFNKGTYWIYKDSASGKEDSFYVASNRTSVSAGTEYNNTDIEIPDLPYQTDLNIRLNENHVQYTFLMVNAGCGFYYPYGPSGTPVPALSINGITYDSVREHAGSAGTFYVRHGIGILKMNVAKDTLKKVWELQRYNIVM